VGSVVNREGYFKPFVFNIINSDNLSILMALAWEMHVLCSTQAEHEKNFLVVSGAEEKVYF
jgi:hypothetical protein